MSHGWNPEPANEIRITSRLPSIQRLAELRPQRWRVRYQQLVGVRFLFPRETQLA